MYSHTGCSICLEHPDFRCSGKCQRCFCKSCFTSPEVHSFLQHDLTSVQSPAEGTTPATFLCLYCSRGQRICCYCFRPTSQKDFVCKHNGCSTSAHYICLMNFCKRNAISDQCPLHTCAICSTGSQGAFSKSRGRRPSESFMLTCARCLKTAHLKCNNSHPIFQLIYFSNSSTDHGPMYSVLCRQCRMQVNSSFSALADSCSFMQKYKSFRLNELTAFHGKNNQSAPSPLSHDKISAIVSACEPYSMDLFLVKYMALLGVPPIPISVTFSSTDPQVIRCTDKWENRVAVINDRAN